VVGPQGARQPCPLLLQDAVGGLVPGDVLVSLDGNRSPDQGQLHCIQGGSDKSGIFFFFLLNGIVQLKISDFIEVKNN
jgi:hypothetical protein